MRNNWLQSIFETGSRCLALSRKMANQMGGNLELVPSKVGAHFRISLPIVQQILTTKVEVKQPYPKAAMTALIVDDEAAIRGLVNDVLVDLGVSVCHEAADGVEACSLLQEHEYHLICTDFNMPNKNGIELVEAIHELNPDPMPVIAMITAGAPELVDPKWRSRLVGKIEAQIGKPFEDEDFAFLVETASKRFNIARGTSQTRVAGNRPKSEAELFHNSRKFIISFGDLIACINDEKKPSRHLVKDAERLFMDLVMEIGKVSSVTGDEKLF